MSCNGSCLLLSAVRRSRQHQRQSPHWEERREVASSGARLSANCLATIRGRTVPSSFRLWKSFVEIGCTYGGLSARCFQCITSNVSIQATNFRGSATVHVVEGPGLSEVTLEVVADHDFLTDRVGAVLLVRRRAAHGCRLTEWLDHHFRNVGYGLLLGVGFVLLVSRSLGAGATHIERVGFVLAVSSR